MLDLLSVTPELFIVLLLAAFCAGCIDSVVGGGGMIQLPALLMAPGFSPVAALSTNKIASSMGTLTSASTYIRSLKIPWKILLPVAFVAFCASADGAYCATILPAHIFRPAIVVVLAAILVFSVLQPRIPRGQSRALTTSSFLVRGFALGLILGGYDGILGAGTGAMMLVALQVAMGYDMLHATAAAKVLTPPPTSARSSTSFRWAQFTGSSESPWDAPTWREAGLVPAPQFTWASDSFAACSLSL